MIVRVSVVLKRTVFTLTDVLAIYLAEVIIFFT